MPKGVYPRTPAMAAQMSTAARQRAVHDPFGDWCFRQAMKISADLRHAERRREDRIRTLKPASELVIESRGTTHGGGPSHYNQFDGDDRA